MLRLEIKKNLENLSFLLAVLLLYLLFLMGYSGEVLPGDQSTTVIGAIWNKLHGNWQTCFESSYLLRMHRMWCDNYYLPVLLPFLCGLPSAMVYLDEVHTGNKKWILPRSSYRCYYSAKILANIISAMLVSVLAVIFYDITLFLFFDHLPFSHEDFPVVYAALTGGRIEDVSTFSVSLIGRVLLKNLLYFLLYSVMCNSLCFWIVVWCREKYTVFGVTVFLSYLPCRIYEELVHKYVDTGHEILRTASDIVSPIFLYYAGRSGFYENKEWLALALTGGIIAVNYGLAVLLSKKYYDVSER